MKANDIILDTYEEQCINDILDKGINEIKGNSLKSSIVNKCNTSNIDEKYNLNYNYNVINSDISSNRNAKSSALKSLLDEMKNETSIKDTNYIIKNNISPKVSQESEELNFNDMKNEINDLQAKIEGLERRISNIISYSRHSFKYKFTRSK